MRTSIREWPDVGSPGFRPRSFDTCQVLRPRRASKPCDLVLGCVAFRLRNSVGTRNFGFRGSMAGLCPPLPTLRRRPCERQRTEALRRLFAPVGLPRIGRHRTHGGEFRKREPRHVVGVGMRVRHAIEHFGHNIGRNYMFRLRWRCDRRGKRGRITARSWRNRLSIWTGSGIARKTRKIEGNNFYNTIARFGSED
jgi:hypothetical protein